MAKQPTKKIRIKIPLKTTLILQKEIKSKCPFCMNEDVAHFEVHHIDENPSNNLIENLLAVCRICHSKITKGDISNIEVILKKADLNSVVKSLNKYLSKETFHAEFTVAIEDIKSPYYLELKEHWNTFNLIEYLPFLNEIINESIARSIHYGLIPLLVDFVNTHLYYNKNSKYVYNQPHIHKRNGENEGWDLPIYYHIRFIGILYANAICNKKDIGSLSNRNRNMLSIYSGMIEGMIANLSTEGVDSLKEYPTNYHWLISEIFSITNNWLETFNDEEYFESKSEYIDFIPLCISLCLDELYKALEANKITVEFLNRKIYYGVLSSYFSYGLNDKLRDSIEDNIIDKIPTEYIDSILKDALDNAFAVTLKDFYAGTFHVINKRDEKPLNRLRNFLIEKGS